MGCIYTAQGFEYDWNGVIFGPDLVWRAGRWVPQPRGSKDPGLRGLGDGVVDPLLRNVYKVLLTRGMVGTAVHSVDPETQEFLSTAPGPSRSAGQRGESFQDTMTRA